MLGVCASNLRLGGGGGLGRAVSSTSSRVGSHPEPGGGEGTRVVGSGDHSELGRRERTGVDFIVPNFSPGDVVGGLGTHCQLGGGEGIEVDLLHPNFATRL
jgi:hypothetical protein